MSCLVLDTQRGLDVKAAAVSDAAWSFQVLHQILETVDHAIIRIQPAMRNYAVVLQDLLFSVHGIIIAQAPASACYSLVCLMFLRIGAT